MKKRIICFMLLVACLMLSACNKTSVSTSFSKTTNKITDKTTSSNTTKNLTSSTSTSITKKEVISSPKENDPRPSGVYSGNSILLDDINKEVTFKNAYRYFTNDSSVDNGSFLTSVEGREFSVTFTPNVKRAGYYLIYISYPKLDNATNYIPLTIKYNGGESRDSSKFIDQTVNNNVWVFIGTYYFTKGSTNSITVQSLDNELISIDSMYFVRNIEMTNTPSPEIIKGSELFEPTSVTSIVMDKTNLSHYLTVDGEPYYVNGICGINELELMAEAGVNTVRTYSTVIGTSEALFDRAYELGIKVIPGLWLLHETTEAIYEYNPEKVEKQKEEMIETIKAFKDHPAVLAWAIGNEVENSNISDYKYIYQAINDVAKAAHEIDPYHPTVAILAGSSTTKINYLKAYCPHIDIYSYNVYKGIDKTPDITSVYPGPYMITEYATNAPDQVSKTTWGAPFEYNNYEKGLIYLDRYLNIIKANEDKNCLGSFAFKDTGSFRITHSWYGLIYEGRKTMSYYLLSSGWKNEQATLMPYLKEIYVNGNQPEKSIYVKPNTLSTVTLDWEYLKDEEITYVLELRREVPYEERVIPSVLNVKFTLVDGKFMFTTPIEEGPYRIYVYGYIDNDYVTLINCPIMVSSK